VEASAAFPHDIIRAVNINEMAPDFELPDLDGRLHRLSDHRGHVVVVNFWSSECPHASRTDQLMTPWIESWGAQVVLLPVVSNDNETLDAIKATSQRRRMPLVLLDRLHRVADIYAAETTPHVFVLDQQGRLRYRGAVDDTSFAQREPARFYLKDAVQALLVGASPGVSETRPYGCTIVRQALE
jgi:peroxiredoxin